jgi:predicted RNase H-like HicB family nuclease
VLTAYIRCAMARAVFETLEDGSCYGEIPGLEGVWSNADTVDMCRKELQEVLEDWTLLGVRLGHELPEIDGVDLNVRLPA